MATIYYLHNQVVIIKLMQVFEDYNIVVFTIDKNEILS